MTIVVYAELRQLFDEVVSGCLVKLLEALRPHKMFELATFAKVPVNLFLTEHAELDGKVPVEQLTEQLKPMLKRDAISAEARQGLVQEFQRANWESWAAAIAGSASGK
jgi:hypothetical protein